MQSNYGRAMFPSGGSVGGYHLHPMTLGHAVLLERIGCPLMPCGARREAGPGDIATLIWVCRRRWDRAVKSIGGRFSRWRRGMIAGRILPEILTTRIEAENYVARQMASPKFDVVRDGDELEAPPLGAIKVALMADLGFSEIEALSRPLSASAWDLAINAERHGAIKLIGRPTEDAIYLAQTLGEKARQEAAQKQEAARG
jgi:hypothetical protein